MIIIQIYHKFKNGMSWKDLKYRYIRGENLSKMNFKGQILVSSGSINYHKSGRISMFHVSFQGDLPNYQ